MEALGKEMVGNKIDRLCSFFVYFSPEVLTNNLLVDPAIHTLRLQSQLELVRVLFLACLQILSYTISQTVQYFESSGVKSVN